jgi:hypothetical protein
VLETLKIALGVQRRRRRLFLGLGEKASAAAAALGGIKSGWMVRFRGMDHPMSSSRKMTNWTLGNGFVKMSAQFSFVSTLWTLSQPFSTWSRKWCHLMERCFVRGRYFSPSLARARAAALSSKMMEEPRPFMQRLSPEQSGEVTDGTLNSFDSSSRRKRMGMSCRQHILRAIYSASHVESAISV